MELTKELAEKRAAFKKRMEARTGQRLDKPFGYQNDPKEIVEEFERRIKQMNKPY